jgi:hypothetical protein
MIQPVLSRSPSLVAWAAAALVAASTATASPTPEGIAFFESKIRPVLAEHCYGCHSAEALRAGKLKAALLVDTRAGMQKGGESGAAVVPGKRDDSLLLAALKYDGFEMPPAGKLPDQVIADFEKWIDMGAPDPRDEPLATIDERTIDVAAGREHWSYRRLAAVPVPPVADGLAAWPRNEIDRFVLAAQKAAGIAPSPEAPRATLARRAFFDLTGLPPSPEELAAFLADESPDAYEKLVDRLLASPQFGERWGRHWLDTVRYAESSGYEFDADRGSAYHYRDWVIDAVNADMPYDEFLRLQIAGDLVKPGDYEATRATGFLVAGPYPGQVTAKTVEPIRYDQLDDMVATLGSSVLGMTIGCARCHDHKYDPIGHRDYYAMIACLGKAVQRDTGIDRDPEGTRRKREAWQAERQPVAAAVARFEADEMPARLARWLAGPAAGAQAAPWQVLDPQTAQATKATLVQEPGDVVSASGRLEGDDTYTLTFRTRQQRITAFKIDALASASAPGGGPGTGKDGSFRLTGMRVTAAPLVPAADRKTVAPVLKAIAATFEEKGFELGGAVDADGFTGWSVGGQAGRDHAAVIGFDKPVGFEGGTLLTVEIRFQSKQHGLARFRISATDVNGAIDLAAPTAPQAAREIALLWDTARGVDGAIADQTAARELLGWLRRFDSDAEQVLASLDAVDTREPKPQLTQVYATTNGPWVITGNSQGVTSGSQDVFVLARGEVGRKKGKAAPGFVLATIASDDAESHLLAATDPQTTVEPRLGLASFLTDVDRGAGPLAARVIVNRLWHHHFGRGIVATPNDLGTQGDPPSHPELLEWLAGRLVEQDWSLKAIHRLIVTSATYRQSGEVREAARSIDPDNRLLWHRRPTRLEGEVIRDAVLAVSGRLETTMHGPSFTDVAKPRRSIYLRVKRSEPDAFLRVFDQPEPVQSVGARGIATVPTQALAMMNSPLVRQAAEGLAARVRKAAGDGGAAVEIDRLFLTALSRDPTTVERERFVAFLDDRRKAAGADQPRRDAALVDTCQLVLCLNEFIYVD